MGRRIHQKSADVIVPVETSRPREDKGGGLTSREGQNIVRPSHRMTLLGYGFYGAKGGCRLRIAPRSIARFKAKLKELTRKNRPVPMKQRLERLTQMCRRWIGCFKLADACSHLVRMDEWVRSRLRYCIWHQWKRVRTRFKALVKLGVNRRNAYIWANTRKGGWHTAHSYVMKLPPI